MKKIPYGIINYKELITGDYEYIDKTMYLEKLENFGKTLIYLRPGRFGKSLFTSMMFYYYDINSKDEFDCLFGETYVGKNPTQNKNNYYVLTFDFSAITTANMTMEQLNKEFAKKVILGIESFLSRNNLEYTIDKGDTPNGILLSFLSFFESLKYENKLYIMVDEYDNFTNGILEGDATLFKSIVNENGFIKSFYAGIKDYVAKGIVDKFFATGICPITLNSMTTGFNIATDISTDVEFNSMIGLTHEEVKTAIANVVTDRNKAEIFDVMLKHYDGYLFSKEAKARVFNATLVMYFLKGYSRFNTIPDELYDKNIVVNYGKIDNLIKLQNNSFYKELIEETLKKDSITGILKTQFNLMEDFTRDDIVSLLYYFGYLTIDEVNIVGTVKFKIPNYVMKMTYGNYLLKILRDYDIRIKTEVLNGALLEIAEQGKIEKITNYVSEILSMHDNRMFISFDEKYIQSLYFSLLQDNTAMNIYTEYPCKNGYIDLYIEGKINKLPHDVMVEFKYIKKGEKNIAKLVEEKRVEGIEQLKKYFEDERIPKSTLKYIVVFVGNDVKLLESVN